MSKKKNSRTISIDLDHVALLCLKIMTLKKRVEVLESACKSGVGYEPIHGLEPRKFSEALAESSRIAKGEV